RPGQGRSGDRSGAAVARRLRRKGRVMKHRKTLVAGTAAATVSLMCAATAAGAATSGVRAAGSGSTTPAEVRVNQVGYPPDGAKVAYAMLPTRVGQVSWPSVEPASDY